MLIFCQTSCFFGPKQYVMPKMNIRMYTDIYFRIDSHAVWLWLIIFLWLLRNSVDQFGIQILLQCRAFTFRASLALKKEPKHALFWNLLGISFTFFGCRTKFFPSYSFYLGYKLGIVYERNPQQNPKAQQQFEFSHCTVYFSKYLRRKRVIELFLKT